LFSHQNIQVIWDRENTSLVSLSIGKCLLWNCPIDGVPNLRYTWLMSDICEHSKHVQHQGCHIGCLEGIRRPKHDCPCVQTSIQTLHPTCPSHKPHVHLIRKYLSIFEYVWVIFKEFVFNFFFWTSDLYISQAFWQYQACQILTPYEPVMKFCTKRVLIYFFMYFLRSSYMEPYGWNCPRVEG
jgi:hypothetical protein